MLFDMMFISIILLHHLYYFLSKDGEYGIVTPSILLFLLLIASSLDIGYIITASILELDGLVLGMTLVACLGLINIHRPGMINEAVLYMWVIYINYIIINDTVLYDQGGSQYVFSPNTQLNKTFA